MKFKKQQLSRRALLRNSSIVGLSFLLSGCGKISKYYINQFLEEKNNLFREFLGNYQDIFIFQNQLRKQSGV